MTIILMDLYFEMVSQNDQTVDFFNDNLQIYYSQCILHIDEK